MEKVGRAYGEMSEQYINLFSGTAWRRKDDLSIIARHLSARPGPVLDVGCGPGYLTDYLRSLDLDAFGIDLVPEFIEHARNTFPDGRYELGSQVQLPIPHRSLSGILSWYSLIHLAPDELGEALTELRRVIVPGGSLVCGFFESDEVSPFDHAVMTAYYWPADEFSERLREAGFTEVERLIRPGEHVAGRRPHGVIAATAS